MQQCCSQAGDADTQISKDLGHSKWVSYVGLTAFAGLPAMGFLGNLEGTLNDAEVGFWVVGFGSAKDFA
jgi:hypothetical protein